MLVLCSGIFSCTFDWEAKQMKYRVGCHLLYSLCFMLYMPMAKAEPTQDALHGGNPAPLDWLAGRWCMPTGSGWIEEAWLAPVGGQLMGLSRTIKAGKVVGFEYMRIESDAGSTRFIPQPQGAPPVVFTATEVAQNRLVVENPEHDFPQKVVYRREGEALTATISGPGDNGQQQSMDFNYQACKD
jgi:hypothetical protein